MTALSACSCRIWVFSSQHLCLRGWEWTSSWKAPSCPTEWNWTGRLSGDWPTCLDRCQVPFSATPHVFSVETGVTFYSYPAFKKLFVYNLHFDKNIFTLCMSVLTSSMYCAFSGSGIGTGPGVIQDRYSPTMGRHRTNPLFNGHGGHIAPPPQSQFDMGPKSFVKSNQVISLTVEINVIACFSPNPQVKVPVLSFLPASHDPCLSTGSESAFPQPEPEPHGPAAGPVQGHASTIQQERTAQCRWGIHY